MVRHTHKVDRYVFLILLKCIQSCFSSKKVHFKLIFTATPSNKYLCNKILFYQYFWLWCGFVKFCKDPLSYHLFSTHYIMLDAFNITSHNCYPYFSPAFYNFILNALDVRQILHIFLLCSYVFYLY